MISPARIEIRKEEGGSSKLNWFERIALPIGIFIAILTFYYDQTILSQLPVDAFKIGILVGGILFVLINKQHFQLFTHGIICFSSAIFNIIPIFIFFRATDSYLNKGKWLESVYNLNFTNFSPNYIFGIILSTAIIVVIGGVIYLFFLYNIAINISHIPFRLLSPVYKRFYGIDIHDEEGIKELDFSKNFIIFSSYMVLNLIVFVPFIIIFL